MWEAPGQTLCESRDSDWEAESQLGNMQDSSAGWLLVCACLDRCGHDLGGSKTQGRPVSIRARFICTAGVLVCLNMTSLLESSPKSLGIFRAWGHGKGSRAWRNVCVSSVLGKGCFQQPECSRTARWVGLKGTLRKTHGGVSHRPISIISRPARSIE